jgi:hypothetical protein
MFYAVSGDNNVFERFVGATGAVATVGQVGRSRWLSWRHGGESGVIWCVKSASTCGRNECAGAGPVWRASRETWSVGCRFSKLRDDGVSDDLLESTWWCSHACSSHVPKGVDWSSNTSVRRWHANSRVYLKLFHPWGRKIRNRTRHIDLLGSCFETFGKTGRRQSNQLEWNCGNELRRSCAQWLRLYRNWLEILRNKGPLPIRLERKSFWSGRNFGVFVGFLWNH